MAPDPPLYQMGSGERVRAGPYNNNSNDPLTSNVFARILRFLYINRLAQYWHHEMLAKWALVKDVVPVFRPLALLSPNSRDIFFSPNGDNTGTTSLTSAAKCMEFSMP